MTGEAGGDGAFASEYWHEADGTTGCVVLLALEGRLDRLRAALGGHDL